MSYYSELAESVAKALRRDEANKQRLAVRCARLGYAFDGSEAEESAKEFAARLLAKLGLKPADDPVEALDSYLTGRDMGDAQRARDADSPMPFRARDFNIPGGALAGGNLIRQGGSPIVGQGYGTQESHGMDGADKSFVDKYLGGK